MVQAVDTARVIVQITKDNRPCRTSVLASRTDISVMNFAVALGSRIDFAVLNALNAVSTLLHNPASTHRNFGIKNQRLELLGSLFALVLPSVEVTVLIVVVEVVESPYFVRAIVRTVPSSNTTVVSHRIDPLFGVHCCRDRADLLARCCLAVCTGHGLHDHLGIDRVLEPRLRFRWINIRLEVPVDSQPMHLTTTDDLLFANDRDVVLSLASHHARVATSALV